MLQKEFEDRTGVKVSPDEYSAIDAVYMASDIDKDSFCKIWCKMNKSRVKYSKEFAKWLKGLDFSIENSYGDNGMDYSTNWHDTYWTNEFVYNPSKVDEDVFIEWEEKDYV